MNEGKATQQSFGADWNWWEGGGEGGTKPCAR